MKTQFIITIYLLLISCSLLAQNNKPFPNAWGIGYQVNLDSQGASQNFTFSRMLNGNWEVGTGIGFRYYHANSETEDSSVAVGFSGAIPVLATNSSELSYFTFSLSPFLLKHCNITSNLDCYFGPVVPLSFGSKTTNTSSNEVSGKDYFSSNENINKTPPFNSVGLGVILGSRFFFYRNLAIGAQYNLSGSYFFQSGESTTETNYTNSGSDNPSNGQDYHSEFSGHKKNTSTSIGTSSNFGLNLTFYFD